MSTPEAIIRNDFGGEVNVTAVAGMASGQILQLGDGRAAILGGLNVVTGSEYAAYTNVLADIKKAASIVLLNGQKIYWDAANNQASYTGDWYLGTAQADAAAAATTVRVHLNAIQEPLIALNKGTWSEVESTAAVTSIIGGGVSLDLTTAGSAQHAWLTSDQVIDIDEGPILEAWVDISDNGDNAVVDIDWGLADAAGTTDFDALSEFIAFHLDGNDLDLDVHSDDGSNDVAPADTDDNLTEGQFQFYQIDLRDSSAPKVYHNGVEKLAATDFDMSNYTSTLRAAIAIEKSGTDDTPGGIRAREFNVRTGLR